MKKIILIFILTLTIASANTYVFWVDSPEMTKMYSLVFEAIKRIFGSESYVDILKLIFLFGGFFTLVAGVMKGFGQNMSGVIQNYFKYIATGVALLVLIFAGSSTLIIKSETLGSTCTTDSPQVINTTISGFPTILGASFSFINRLGTYMTHAVEKEYTTVNMTAGLNNGGYAHTVRDSIRLLDINLDDSNGTKQSHMTLKNFLAQCIIIPYSGKGDSGIREINNLKSSPNIYDYLNKLFITNPVDVGGILSSDYSLNVNGEIRNCGEYYAAIKPSLDDFRQNIGCSTHLGFDAATLIMGGTPNQSNFQDMAIQAGMVTALRDSYQNAGSGISATSYASGKSKSEMVQSNIANGAYMAEMLPMLQMTLRVILYAFFPFVFIIIMLPEGLRVLGQYAKSLLWVELWTPVAAALNMFLNMRAGNDLQDIYGGTGMTYISAVDMMSSSSIIAGMAGYLYLMVPGLTWAFISGTAMMLETLAHGIAAHMQKNIRTEEINMDMSVKAKTKEVSAQAGKDFSMAEMQHYEAVQNGRIEGAELGLQMKAGMDTMTDKAASKEQEEISEYVRSANATGVGGASHGDAKGAKRAVKTVTDIKTGIKVSSGSGGKKNLTTVAKDAAEVDSRNETGSMKGKSDLKEDLTKDVYTNIEKDKQIQGIAKSDILNKYGVDGMHQYYVDKTSLSVDETKVTAGYGTMFGENKVFDAKKTNAANKEAERLGAGPEKQGKAKGFNDAKTTYKIETEREELAKENMGATEAGKVEGIAAAENTFKLKEYQDQLSTLTPAQRAKASVRNEIVNTANNFLKEANGISIGDEVRAKLSDDMSTINGKNEFLDNGGTTDQRTNAVKTNIETETGKAAAKQAIAGKQGISVQKMEMNRESFGNSTYRLGEDGKIHKETHDSNGNVTHEVITDNDLTEYKEIVREKLIEYLRANGYTEEEILEMIKFFDTMLQVDQLTGAVSLPIHLMLKPSMSKRARHKAKVKFLKTELTKATEMLKHTSDKEKRKALEKNIESLKEYIKEEKRRSNSLFKNLYNDKFLVKAEENLKDLKKQLKEAKKDNSGLKHIKIFELKEQIRVAEIEYKKAKDKFYNPISRAINIKHQAKEALRNIGKFEIARLTEKLENKKLSPAERQKLEADLEKAKKRNQIGVNISDLKSFAIKKASIFKNEREKLKKDLKNPDLKLTAIERAKINKRIEVLDNRIKKVRIALDAKNFSVIKIWREQTSGYNKGKYTLAGEQKEALERMKKNINERQSVFGKKNWNELSDSEKEHVKRLNNELREDQKFLKASDGQFFNDRFKQKKGIQYLRIKDIDMALEYHERVHNNKKLSTMSVSEIEKLNVDVMRSRATSFLGIARNVSVFAASQTVIAEGVNQMSAYEGNTIFEVGSGVLSFVGDVFSIAAHGLYDDVYKNAVDSYKIDEYNTDIENLNDKLMNIATQAKELRETLGKDSNEYKAKMEEVYRVEKEIDSKIEARDHLEEARIEYLHEPVFDKLIENTSKSFDKIANSKGLFEGNLRSNATESALSSDLIRIEKTLVEKGYDAVQFIKNNLTAEQLSKFEEGLSSVVDADLGTGQEERLKEVLTEFISKAKDNALASAKLREELDHNLFD